MRLCVRAVALALVAGGLLVRCAIGAPEGPGQDREHGKHAGAQRWSLEDGLPQSTVSSIAQDSKGYLWLGTEAGLVRFDGLRFTVFDRSNTPELKTDHISALLLDRGDALWIGTRNGLVLHQQGKFEVLTESNGLPDKVVEALALESNGDLWVGTRGGLCRLPATSPSFCEGVQGLAGHEVFSLVHAMDGTLWVGLRGGLRRIRDNEVEAPPSLNDLESQLFLSLESDPKGLLWAGSAYGGLFRIDTSLLRGTLVQGTEQEIILSIHRDPEAGLWLGTRKGLKRYDGKELSRVDDLAEDTIYTLYRDGIDHLWVGTRNDGVFRLPLTNEEPPGPPTVLIEEVRVNGKGLSLEQLAANPPRGRGDLEFRFTAVEFSEPASLTFLHFLEGFQETWSEPSSQRYVSYTNLPPGNYRMRVRLAASLSMSDADDAALAFRIDPLFYQTALFRFSLLLLAIVALRGLYQLRVRRLLHTQGTLERLTRVHTREVLQQKEEISTSYRRLERANRLLRRTNLELTKRSREKSDFLAIATHDIRAPLVNLKGFTAELAFAFQRAERFMSQAISHLNPTTQLLARRTLNKDLPEYIDFINSSAERIESLIEPILKVSRIHRRSLQLRPVSLLERVENLLILHRTELEAQGVHCEVDHLGSLLSDETILQEALEHLFLHTLDSLGGIQGGKIQFRSNRSEAETIVLIRRNGPLVDKDKEDRAFRFFGRNGIDDGKNGDLEMTYARALIQRLGGRIWIQRETDRTSIYFSIPINPGQIKNKI